MRDDQFARFLRSRREAMRPEDYGYSSERRRTPGLRREEVAQRANVSVTWYTWLEQDRGGVPSADMLERLSRALDLNAHERELLFLLAQSRPPKASTEVGHIPSPQVQRLLTTLEGAAAYIKNYRWDVLWWNKAAAAVLTNYGALEPSQRNILRILFGEPHVRRNVVDWEQEARDAVGTFRLEIARKNAADRVAPLVSELSAMSEEFRTFWRSGKLSTLEEGCKRLQFPGSDEIKLDYNSFTIDGSPELGLVVYSPCDAASATLLKRLSDNLPDNVVVPLPV